MDAAERSRRAYADLQQVCSLIRRALEHGLLEAAKYFDSCSMDVDPFTYAVLVRLHVRTMLRKWKLEATDEAVASDLEVERASLCALHLKIYRYHLKVWKISEDDLRTALTRQDASERQLSLLDENHIPIIDNLVIRWTSDSCHRLVEVRLAQPVHDDPKCLDWIWSCPIPLTPATPESIHAGDIPLEDIATETAETTHWKG